MPQRPCGAVVAIFGIQSSDYNCSCECHPVCGRVVTYDTLIRFEKRVVETGPHQYEKMGVARWITDGVERCIVGRLGLKYYDQLDLLDGRLVQVVDIFSKSKEKSKIDYNRANDGVALGRIVDRFEPGDRLLNGLLDSFENEMETNEIE